MKDLEEQCFCVKFCFKLGKTFTETFQMLQQSTEMMYVKYVRDVLQNC